MKTALAVVCSLLLLGTLFVQAGAAGASVASSVPTCCCVSACCSADIPNPEPQPVSAAPVFSFSSHLLAPVSITPIWMLPEAPLFSFFPPPHFPAEAAPLYVRVCALLI
jgi:hypothetical protein